MFFLIIIIVNINKTIIYLIMKVGALRTVKVGYAVLRDVIICKTRIY